MSTIHKHNQLKMPIAKLSSKFSQEMRWVLSWHQHRHLMDLRLLVQAMGRIQLAVVSYLDASGKITQISGAMSFFSFSISFLFSLVSSCVKIRFSIVRFMFDVLLIIGAFNNKWIRNITITALYFFMLMFALHTFIFIWHAPTFALPCVAFWIRIDLFFSVVDWM